MCDQTFGFSIEGQSSRPLTPARWCSAQSLPSCISFLFGVECIPTVCPQLPLLLSRKKKKECISNYPMWLSHNCHHELTARKPYLSGLAACDADWMLAAQTYSQTPTNIFLNFLTMVFKTHMQWWALPEVPIWKTNIYLSAMITHMFYTWQWRVNTNW